MSEYSYVVVYMIYKSSFKRNRVSDHEVFLIKGTRSLHKTGGMRHVYRNMVSRLRLW